MANGPGKYDFLATYARETAHAQGVILIVFDGDLGSGFSVQMTGVPEHLIDTVVVGALREAADGIERSGV